jgi:hypothetical protein
LPPRYEKAPVEPRRAGRIAQNNRTSSVHKPYALTSAQIEEKPKKQHNQKTRRGKRNKKHAQERLAEKNYIENRTVKCRLIKHADVTLVRNLVASVLIPTANQETATTKNTQNQSFPNQPSGKVLFKTFSNKSMPAKRNW